MISVTGFPLYKTSVPGFIFAITTESFKIKLPMCSGPEEKIKSLSFAEPKLLLPSFSQKRPTRLSQPVSSFSRDALF